MGIYETGTVGRRVENALPPLVYSCWFDLCFFRGKKNEKDKWTKTKVNEIWVYALSMDDLLKQIKDHVEMYRPLDCVGDILFTSKTFLIRNGNVTHSSFSKGLKYLDWIVSSSLGLEE